MKDESFLSGGLTGSPEVLSAIAAALHLTLDDIVS
jgi:hypothetical protein